jgi:DNA uptake protein ComE-like DNA-binding protein
MTARTIRVIVIAAIAAFALAGASWADAPASAPSAPAATPASPPSKPASATPSPRVIAATEKAQAAGMTAKPGDLLDINSATKEQLAKLPGIGDVYAAKIIAARPYKMKTDLFQKRILPMSEYQKIAGLIIAKQPPPAAPGSATPAPAAPKPGPDAPAAPAAPKP